MKKKKMQVCFPTRPICRPNQYSGPWTRIGNMASRLVHPFIQSHTFGTCHLALAVLAKALIKGSGSAASRSLV